MALGGQGKLNLFRGAAQLGRTDRRFLTAGRCAVYCLLGLLMSSARILGSGGPFGLALVACAGPGLAGVSALVGASLGYLLGGGLEWGIRYIAASVLVYTTAFVFHELPVSRREFFMPSAAGLIMAFTGWLGGYSTEAGPVPVIPELFLESTLAFGGAYFFREALAGRPGSTETAELKHSVSLMILAACALMTVSRLELFGIVSLGRFLALLLVMTSAMKGGMLTGAAVGTVLGLAMDVTHAGAPFYTMSYSLCGLLSGVFGRHGRLLFVLSFLLSSALAVVCAWNTEIFISALFESFCASVIFMLLPAALLNRAGVILQAAEHGSGEAGLRRFVARRVKDLSEAYEELYAIVSESVSDPYNDENVARVFDRAADAVCVRCRNKNRCWNADYLDTLSAMNDATRAMVENGSLTAEDLPGFFREKCTGLPAFVAAVNGELRGLSYRRQLRQRLAESRSAAWAQYEDLAQVLSGVARELGSINGADPLAERRLLRYLRGLEIDAEAAVYRDGGGRLRVVIESGRLSPLTREEDYLEKLSAVVGVRLCQPEELREGSSRLTLLEAEPLAVSVGIAALKKRGETVNGDKGSYFKTDSGVLCVLLSDGMGAGDEAARDSARVVTILEKFLRAGVDPAAAMKILNSVMLLRSADSWGFATVDLMCVDLFSGEACFYKYGAAPSYVRQGGPVTRLTGRSLPAGLQSDPPEATRLQLKPGSFFVMISDGVADEDSDLWLRELLAQWQGRDADELASRILSQSRSRSEPDDDRAVLVLHLPGSAENWKTQV